MWILHEIQAIAASRPWLLFLAIAFLPGVGFPVSLLFAAAGVVWGTSVSSCAIVIAALAVNLTWTYWLTRSPFGAWFRSKLPGKWLKFLETEKGGAMRILLAVRITPAMPLFIQNYLLGLLRIPFQIYLPVSLVFNSLWACAYMLSGGAVFRGQIGYAIAGGSLFIVAILLSKIVSRYLSVRRSISDAPPVDTPN